MTGKPGIESCAFHARKTPTQYRVQARVIINILDALDELNVDTTSIRRHAQGSLEAPQSRLPATLYHSVCAMAVEVSGIESICLKVGASIEGGKRELADFVTGTQPTLGAAIAKGEQLLPLLNETLVLGVEESNEHIRYSLLPPLGLNAPWAVSDYNMARLVATSRFLLQQRSANPLLVELVRPLPKNSKPWRDFYRCEVRFGREFDAITLPIEYLQRPLPTANAQLCSALERQLERELAELPNFASTTDSVRRAYAVKAQAEAQPTLNCIARLLAMSPRTLRRRLSEEGTSFSEVISECRLEIAVRHLRDAPRANLSEIAVNLGFSNHGAFHRAFKRWTGQSPADFRKQAKTVPPGADETDLSSGRPSTTPSGLDTR